MKRRFTNRKARTEKKFTKNAMELLLLLMPTAYSRKDFSVESDCFTGLHGSVYYDEWVAWDSPDYWTGEQDYYDAFYLLRQGLITQTTDWDGIGRAHDAVGWDSGVEVDESPFYSPLRGASRAQVISHCRKLVAAKVTW